ncbi:MAG: hypothetical protein ACREPR_26855 [Brasilonema sp.]
MKATEKRTIGGYIEIAYTLPRLQAREAAKRYFERYPKHGYDTHVAHWHVTADNKIHFVMRRLHTCD